MHKLCIIIHLKEFWALLIDDKKCIKIKVTLENIKESLNAQLQGMTKKSMKHLICPTWFGGLES